MHDSPPVTQQMSPCRPTGVLRLRWFGSVLLLGGVLLLGWDILTCFTSGTRVHLALT